MSSSGDGFATRPTTPISKLLEGFDVKPTNNSWDAPMDLSPIMSDHEESNDERKIPMPENALADLLVQASSVASTSTRPGSGIALQTTMQVTRSGSNQEDGSSETDSPREEKLGGNSQDEKMKADPPWRKDSKAFCECMYPPVVPEHPEMISLQIANYRRCIGEFMQHLFPDAHWSIEEDHDESAGDPDGNMWPVYQIFMVCLEDREMIATGEYIADLPGAYQSLGNVLRDEVILSGGPYQKDLPLSWGKVSQYSGMKCSCCKQLRPCMSSVREWTRELEKRQS